MKRHPARQVPAQDPQQVKEYYCPFCTGLLKDAVPFIEHQGKSCQGWRQLLKTHKGQSTKQLTPEQAGTLTVL